MKKFNLNKKKVAALLASTICISTLPACGDTSEAYNNYSYDTFEGYNKAILVNGECATIVNVEKWWRSSNSECVEMVTTEGFGIKNSFVNTYLINDLNTDLTAYDFAKSLVGENGQVIYFGEQENTNNKEKVYTAN